MKVIRPRKEKKFGGGTFSSVLLIVVLCIQVLDCGFEGQECKDDEGLCDHLLDKLDTFEK